MSTALPPTLPAYKRLLRHLDACSPCRGNASCVTGQRIRRDLRAERDRAVS